MKLGKCYFEFCRTVVIGLLWLLWTAPGWAGSGGFFATDIESYLNYAFERNPQLKAFEARYDAAVQRIPQARSLPEPMFSVSHFVESVETRTGPQENIFMLSQRIPWFGKLKNRKYAVTAAGEALWYAYQNQQLILARTVSVRFYEYGYVGQAIALTRENLALLEKLEPIVEERVKGGGELNALLRLKVEIGKVADKLESLKQRRVVQSARLKELLALANDGGVLPWPDWSAPQPRVLDERSLARAITANNPELKMLERKVASAEADRQVARLENYPDITLGVNYIQTGNPSVNSSTPDAGRDPWAVTVAVSLPLWFDKYNASRAEARARKRAKELDYENRANTLQTDLVTSLAMQKDAHRRLKLYGTELLGLAKQAVENSMSSYESGRVGILAVIDSERSLLELQLFYWRAAADAWQQRIVLQTLTNQPNWKISTNNKKHE